MRVSVAQVKAITNHTVSQAFVSWLPSSRFDIRALVAAQHGWISSSSVCVDPQDSDNALHSLWSRCSSRSSHCATIVSCPGALIVRVNVWSAHHKSDMYLDGIWIACVASPSVPSRRLETRTCSLCSIGTHTNRHSTCICASVSRRVVHHAFAARPGL